MLSELVVFEGNSWPVVLAINDAKMNKDTIKTLTNWRDEGDMISGGFPVFDKQSGCKDETKNCNAIIKVATHYMLSIIIATSRYFMRQKPQ